MNGQTTIYSLRDPKTSELRYIGKTVRSLKDRLRGHHGDSMLRRNHRNNWIRSLESSPIIEPLMEVADDFGASAEIYAIALYRSLGYRLVNESAGGEGALGVKFTPERLAKMSAVAKGRKYTPKQLESVAKRKTLKTHCINDHEYTPETLVLDGKGYRHCRICANASSLRAYYRKQSKVTPEQREAAALETHTKRSKAHKGKKLSPETRAKISAVQKGKKRGPYSEERRANISAALKGKQLGRVLTAEARQKISMTLKARTHCRKGHEYTEATSYVTKQGWRACRLCSRANDRKRAPRRRRMEAN